jgi:hypothetical protein
MIRHQKVKKTNALGSRWLLHDSARLRGCFHIAAPISNHPSLTIRKPMISKIRTFCIVLICLSAGAVAPYAQGQATSAPTASAPNVLAAASSTSTAPMAHGQRIYASHHSFYLGIPDILKGIAPAGGYQDQVIVGSDLIGGSKTLQHWIVPDAQNKTKQALMTGQVDVLILTPVYLPDDGIENFAQFGLQYNPNLRVALMEFWLPYDVYNPSIYDHSYKPQTGEPPLMPRPGKVDHNAATIDALRQMHTYYFQTMDGLVSSLNQKLGHPVIFVVPMGQAVLALREKVIAGQAPGIKDQESLFRDQLGHPQPPMQVLEAYCFYSVIYRKSPVGLPVPSVLAKATWIPPEDDAPLNLLLQQLAWDAVTHHPLSGVAQAP